MTMYEERAGRLADRFLRALAIAKGDVRGALGFVEGQARWSADRKELTKALLVQKQAVGAIAVGGSALELVDVGVSFLNAPAAARRCIAADRGEDGTGVHSHRRARPRRHGICKRPRRISNSRGPLVHIGDDTEADQKRCAAGP